MEGMQAARLALDNAGQIESPASITATRHLPEDGRHADGGICPGQCRAD
jgi:hypothetical protein